MTLGLTVCRALATSILPWAQDTRVFVDTLHHLILCQPHVSRDRNAPHRTLKVSGVSILPPADGTSSVAHINLSCYTMTYQILRMS